MQVVIRTINETGMQEIRAILAENHKLGAEHFSDSMIQAWANDAQFQLDEGNAPSIEVDSWSHVRGITQDFHLSDGSYDTCVVEIDD